MHRAELADDRQPVEQPADRIVDVRDVTVVFAALVPVLERDGSDPGGFAALPGAAALLAVRVPEKLAEPVADRQVEVRLEAGAAVVSVDERACGTPEDKQGFAFGLL